MNQMSNDMNDSVHTIIRNVVPLDEDFALTDELNLLDIPGMDSLAQVRLVMEIDKLLDERLNMNEMLSIESVGSIRTLLQAKGKLGHES
jgi:acyl carrier protein